MLLERLQKNFAEVKKNPGAKITTVSTGTSTRVENELAKEYSFTSSFKLYSCGWKNQEGVWKKKNILGTDTTAGEENQKGKPQKIQQFR